jgi:hypothetical protein
MLPLQESRALLGWHVLVVQPMPRDMHMWPARSGVHCSMDVMANRSLDACQGACPRDNPPT